MSHHLPCTTRTAPAWATASSASWRAWACAGLLGLGLLNPVGAQAPQAPAGKDAITLQFVNADIEAVARTVATLARANVVVDPRVKGTMSLSSTQPVSAAQALRLFAAQLRTQGYALVENAGIYTVVPEAEAKLQSSTVGVGAAAAGGQVQTHIFRLQHENANALVPVLRPLISPNNTINVAPGGNAVVITDYADNLQRLGRIIAALDVANATGVDVIRLEHGLASDMAVLVQRLLDANPSGGFAQASAGAGPQAPTGVAADAYRTTVLPDVRSNSLIVRAANAARLGLVRALVAQLDTPSASGPQAANGNIHVVYLKNADAARLAVTLRAALAAEPRASANPGGALGAAGGPVPMAASGVAPGSPNSSAAPAPSTGGQIQADPATNALIISAPEPQYRQLRAVIDQLDQRRAQVFVESLIAEVSEDRASELGVQWQGPIGRSGDGSIGLLGTNFSVGGANIVDLAARGTSGNALPSTGLNAGALTRTGNGTYVLGFLARFLQSTGNGNVLSTPNLLTLDNEEAKIVIGQNVPFITGQYANTTTPGSVGATVNPFQTIERRDVGLTLRVRPQISESGTIKMQIYQEVSSIDPKSENRPSGLITNKRSIESSVLVEDGAIVVLGGLLQDDSGDNQQRVPGLANLPLLGALFKADSRSRKKTNLMVFLRPVVMRDGAAAQALSLGRYEQMRTLQQNSPVLVPLGSPADKAPPVVLPAPASSPTRP